jgi:hypothetical protein
MKFSTTPNGQAVAREHHRWCAHKNGDVTAVPQTLQMMSDKVDWTQQLGDAFLGAG